MPPKPSGDAFARRKSKSSMIATLKLSPKLLSTFAPAAPGKEEEKVKKETSPPKESLSTVSNPLPVATGSDEKAPDSATPAAATPVPSSSAMPPPTELLKKKGVKRAGPALGPDGLPKPRGKPGPKKKARLEDGSIDHSGTAPRAPNGTAAHKLGPKANQGAINAGLRALDRSGKPCRKWQKGAFKLKSFTGVVWEIPRWTAPPKVTVPLTTESSISGDSSKENKENSQQESGNSEKSNDVDMKGSMSNLVSSPAPSLPAPPPAPVRIIPAVEA